MTKSNSGHGTYEENGAIYSSVIGTVLQTNKSFILEIKTVFEIKSTYDVLNGFHLRRLLSVSPLKAYYTPQIGDIVVGRVIEVIFQNLIIQIDSLFMY